MIVAIMIGRKESKGFPGKNTTMIFGRPLFAYPYMAAQKVKDINEIVVSTDDEKIQDYVETYFGGRTMPRPAYLCGDDAQAGEVYKFVYDSLRLHDTTTLTYELLVLMMCNAYAVTPEIIEQGIRVLRADPSLDSAITVSSYNMWNPARARRIENGILQPMALMENATCDRNSIGDIWFADFGAVIVRPRCLDKLDGLPPQTWMGHRIFPLKQWGGCDLDYNWQVPQAEFWLRQHGYR